jgi:hypothetical protein
MAYPAPSSSLANAAPAAAAPEQVPEKTKDELASMTKAERTAYHKARMAVATAKPKAAANDGLSKADIRAQARTKQEEDRARKENAQNKAGADAEALEELKLQGLTEGTAREVLTQMRSEAASAVVEDPDEDDDDEDTSLLGCVRTWMAEQDGQTIDGDSVRDFNLKVRFQGHVESTPPDHLGATLQVIAAKCFTEMELASVKQPQVVAKKVQPTVAKWAPLLETFYTKCDCLVAAEILVASPREGVADASMSEAARDCVLVGFLMAIRDELEPVDDEDLLTACRKLNSSTKVMQGFIEFLEDQGSDEDDDEESCS